MPAGGTTWATAGAAVIGANTPSPIADYPSGTARPFRAAYWSLTAEEAGRYTFDSNQTTPNTLDTWMDVYDAADGPFTTLLATSDDEGDFALSKTTGIRLDAGQSVIVALGLYGADPAPSGSYVLNVGFAPMGDYDSVVTSVGLIGASTPLAWDGDRQHLYCSSTNNCRYFGIQTEQMSGITALTSGSGWTQTTTSNNDYPSHLNFVRPGIVSLTDYVDSASQYEVSTIRVEGAVITLLANRTFPSQTFTASGFLRGQFSTPDNPQVFFYGASGGGAVGEAWETTIGADGSISAFTSLGAVTFIGFTGSSDQYSALSSTPMAINDRLAVNYFGCIFDRQNPATIRRLAFPAPGGAFSGPPIFYYSEARVRPGHICAVFNGNTTDGGGHRLYRVVDYTISADGSTLTEVGHWDTPVVCSGVSVVAAAELGLVASLNVDGASRRAWSDVLGSPVEIPAGTFSPPHYSSEQMTATGPRGWIESASSTGSALEVVEKPPPPPPPPAHHGSRLLKFVADPPLPEEIHTPIFPVNVISHRDVIGNPSGGSMSFTVPESIQSGDTVFVIVGSGSHVTGAPSGWTTLADHSGQEAQGYAMMKTFSSPVTGPSTYTLSFDGGDYTGIGVIHIRGAFGYHIELDQRIGAVGVTTPAGTVSVSGSDPGDLTFLYAFTRNSGSGAIDTTGNETAIGSIGYAIGGSDGSSATKIAWQLPEVSEPCEYTLPSRTGHYLFALSLFKPVAVPDRTVPEAISSYYDSAGVYHSSGGIVGQDLATAQPTTSDSNGRYNLDWTLPAGYGSFASLGITGFKLVGEFDGAGDIFWTLNMDNPGYPGTPQWTADSGSSHIATSDPDTTTISGPTTLTWTFAVTNTASDPKYGGFSFSDVLSDLEISLHANVASGDTNNRVYGDVRAIGPAGASVQIKRFDLVLTSDPTPAPLEYTTATDPVVDEVSEVVVHGPGGDHHGEFQIPTNRRVSMQAQVTGEPGGPALWVQPWAHYWRLDGTTLAPLSDMAIGPLMAVTTSDWVQVAAQAPVEDPEATHWSLGLRVTAQDGARPPAGAKVYFDCVYVTDNGLDISHEPYLDGDQPLGTWEGERGSSPSIYGPKPPPPQPLQETVLLDMRGLGYTEGPQGSRTYITGASETDPVQGSVLVNPIYSGFASSAHVLSGQGVVEGDGNYAFTPHNKGVLRCKYKRETMAPTASATYDANTSLLSVWGPNPATGLSDSYGQPVAGYDEWFSIRHPNFTDGRQLRFLNAGLSDDDAVFDEHTTGDFIVDDVWYDFEIAWDSGTITYTVSHDATVDATWSSTYLPQRTPVDMAWAGCWIAASPSGPGFRTLSDDAYFAVWV